MHSLIPLRAIIIDDEKRGISALKLLIERYVSDINVIAECTRAKNAIELIEVQRPEIVFLDINMPGMNGFELLQSLSWRSFNLVFTTAHEEYALRALKSNAVDYLLKPISHRDLAMTVSMIRQRIASNQITVKFNYAELFASIQQARRRHILISSGNDVESVSLGEIIYLESRSNYTRICLAGREITTRKTLREFESQLCTPESMGMRVHHSFIINLDKVMRYMKGTGDIVMSNGHNIPLSKSRRELFFSWLNVKL